LINQSINQSIKICKFSWCRTYFHLAKRIEQRISAGSCGFHLAKWIEQRISAGSCGFHLAKWIEQRISAWLEVVGFTWQSG
jgi:hypothetical protein